MSDRNNRKRGSNWNFNRPGPPKQPRHNSPQNSGYPYHGPHQNQGPWQHFNPGLPNNQWDGYYYQPPGYSHPWPPQSTNYNSFFRGRGKRFQNPSSTFIPQKDSLNVNENAQKSEDSLKFKKRIGTTDLGKPYEEQYFPATMILKLLQNKEVVDFCISTNDEKFGAFDDFILDIDYNNGTTEKYAIQLKHRGKPVTLESLNEDKNFCILKYYHTFHNCGQLLSDYKLFLFTNTTFTGVSNIVVNLGDGIESVKIRIHECETSSVINTTENGKSYKFQVEPENSEEIKLKYNDFFEQFFLYSDQLNLHQLKSNFPTSFLTLTKSSAAADKFLKFISEWSFIDGTKDKLTKEMIMKVVTLNIVEELIQPHNFCEVDEKQKLFQSAISHFNITAFGSQYLENVRKIWCDGKSILRNCNINEVNEIIRRFQISIKHIQNVDDLTDDECTKLLWVMDKCPLILKDGPAAYEAAKLCGGKSKFVFITDSLDDEKLEELTTFKTLSDLKCHSSTYNDILENFSFTIFGERKSFGDLIKKDEAFDNLITTDEMAKMVDNPELIKLEEEELCDPYVERHLYKNIIDLKYLQKVDENTMILLSNVGDERQLRESLQNFEFVSIIDELGNDTNDLTKRKKMRINTDASSKKNMQLFNTEGKALEDFNSQSKKDIQNLGNGVTNDTTGAENKADIKKEKKKFSKKYRLFFKKTVATPEEFTSLCNINNKYQKFHHFNYHNEHLEWIESIGDVSDLQKFCIKSEDLVEDEKLFAGKIKNNLSIIIGDPGMGKSIFVKKLKNNLSKYFTVIMQPIDVPELCRSVKHPEDLQIFFTFVLQSKFANCGNLEKQILKLLMEEGKAVFLWDALDELSEENRVFVEKLITTLSKKSVAQFVTARGFLRKEMEDTFKVLSQELQPFSGKQQTDYIEKRLKGLCSGEELESITTAVKENIGNTSYREILEIPLQIYMLTELFRQDLEKYKKLFTELFVITDLYFHFIQEKFNFYFKNKKGYLGDYKQDRSLKRHVEHQKTNYQKLALRLLFGTTFFEHPNKELDDFLDEIKTEGDEFGLITTVDVNNMQSVFLHNSYAEYFAATYLVENCRNITDLRNFIFERKYANVRYFFDTLLAKDSPVHIAVLCQNLNYFRSCEDQDVLKRKDSGGRNALHLAASWGERYPLLKTTELDGSTISILDKIDFDTKEDNSEIVETLLKNCDLDEKDQLFEMTPLAYAEKCECLFAAALIGKSKENQNYLEAKNETFVYSLLYYGIKHNFHKIVDLFKNIKFARTERGSTLLHMAVENNRFQYVKKLLEHEDCKRNINYQPRFWEAALLNASRNGYVEIVKYLIQENADVHVVTEFDETPLHLAAEQGHFEIVKYLIEENNADIHAIDNEGWTPLHAAAQQGHLDIMKYLLQKNANVNAVSTTDWTPLHAAAAEGGHPETVKYLIEKNANVNAVNNNKWTPLLSAAENGDLQTVKYLIQEHANVNAVDNKGLTPLHLAALNGHLETVKYLIQEHVNVNAGDNDGWTPLHFASREGFLETVKYLIEENANANAVDKDGWTPLHAAAHEGHFETVKYLLQKHANVNAVSNDGWTPLHAAAEKGHFQTVEYLIHENANFNALDNEGITSLHRAAKNGHLAIVKYLIKEKADVNAADIDNDRWTPLHLAAQEGHLEIVEYLIQEKANVNAVGFNGRTPLHLAAADGHLEIQKHLIKKNANVNAVSDEGWTPLHAAAEKGHLETVIYLIQKDANVNAIGNDSWTALHLAAQNGHFQTVEYLIQEHANVNAVTNKNWTPLHAAADRGHLEIVKYLIQENAKVNAVDNDGWTPLHAAAENGHLETVKYLIQGKSNVNAVSKEDWTPLHAAAEKGHLETVKYLLQENANVNAVDNYGRTPLHLAASRGQLETLKYFLIQQNGNFDEVDSDGWTLLHSAADSGHLETVKYLIQGNANVNAVDSCDHTPLHLATGGGHLETMKHLIQENANVNAVNDDGSTPLHVAASCGHVEIVKYLLQQNGNINAVDNDGWTVLHTAAQEGHLETLKYLIQKNANVNAANNDGSTPLHVAAEDGRFETVKHLIQENANVNAGNNNGFTPLHAAAQEGHFETVKCLIENGANINTVTRDRTTVLWSAAYGGLLETVAYLTEHGVDVDAADDDGLTPLMVAAKKGHLDIVRYLTQHEADINLCDRDGFTPLHWASCQGYLSIVELLVEAGARTNVE